MKPKKHYPSIDGCNPIHAVDNWSKVRSIMEAARRGESIPPVLVDSHGNGNMLTGTHRAAARELLIRRGEDTAADQIYTITPDDTDLTTGQRVQLDAAITDSDFGQIDELIDQDISK